MLFVASVMFFMASGCREQVEKGIEFPYEVIDVKYIECVNCAPSERPYARDIIPNHDFWFGLGGGKVFIINSIEEMGKYIPGNLADRNIDFPDIDFSKHTLLVACGVTGSVVHKVNINSLLQFSTYKYKLDIELSMTYYGAEDYWLIALITSKLSEESKIELKVTTD